MDRFTLVLKLIFALTIHLYVRVSRAVDAALWELCPELMKQGRKIADAAHAEVCRAQRSHHVPRAKLPRKKTEAALEDTPRAERRQDFGKELARLMDVRSKLKYGTPEYDRLCGEIDEVFAKWRRWNARPLGAI